MNIEELEAAFKSANVLLVKIVDLDGSVGSLALCVIGSLGEYIAAAKALGNPVVFAYLESLATHDFLYPSDDDDAGDEDDNEERDLCAVDPELNAFKKYIGIIGRVTLYAPTPPQGMTHVVEDEWYDRFLECKEAAIESIEQQDADAQTDRDQVEDRRQSALRARLDDLANDKKFARLPTQKAMVEYAKLHISGIDELENADLRDAISKLRARIIAKGIE